MEPPTGAIGERQITLRRQRLCRDNFYLPGRPDACMVKASLDKRAAKRLVFVLPHDTLHLQKRPDETYTPTQHSSLMCLFKRR